jgi:hypothetical protein
MVVRIDNADPSGRQKSDLSTVESTTYATSMNLSSRFYGLALSCKSLKVRGLQGLDFYPDNHKPRF